LGGYLFGLQRIKLITDDTLGLPFILSKQDAYLQQRSTAIESIESTITELGSIFSQLATMVAQQGEQVQRIDQDTIDIESNIQSAQSELLKFYSSISGNRMLMLKVFGMIMIFFLVSSPSIYPSSIFFFFQYPVCLTNDSNSDHLAQSIGSTFQLFVLLT
jgi:predicted PurR-regulated permease PerM